MKTITALILLISISGCYEAPPPQTTSQPPPTPTPVVIQQAAPQTSGMTNLVTGAAIGALATHALSRPTAAPAPVSTHTIERTTVVRTVVKQAAPTKPALAATPRPSYMPAYRATPVYRPSLAKPSRR